MPLPKFNELSTTVQVAVILFVGALLGVGAEFVMLKPQAESNAAKQKQADQLAGELAPLREYERKQRILIAENEQLEIKLATLRQIVPEEKEVDNFIRMIESASNSSNIEVRRFTAKPILTQDYYIEVPFEMELDGAYFQVLGFFDRLSKLERILNVSDMKMGAIEGGKPVGNKPYAYGANETVVAVCTITTFFSREGQAPEPATPAATGRRPPQKK